MKNFRACFRNVLLALSGGAMLLAPSCKDEDIPKSAACDILMFSVDAQRWEIEGANITRNYPPETPEEPLVPTINLSPGATVNPPASEAQNFFAAAGVAYTVTAEDGVTKKTYTARATRTPYADCSITFFGVGDARWSISDSLITYVFPTKTEEALLTPAIGLSPGATVEPPASQAQNFFAEGGVTYTVTSEDGATQKRYHASARNRYSGCSIEWFGVDGVAWAIEDTLISYFYPTTVGTERLTPTIVLSPGATVSPIAGDPQDFFADEGVKYTVTSEDSTATKTYTAKATVETSGGEGWAWEIVGSKLTIRGVNATMPSYRRTTPPWEEQMANIQTVAVAGVLNVGDLAFYQYPNLTSVTISNTVTHIGYFAFGDCQNLASVNILSPVEIIDTAAFNYCYALSSIALGNSVRIIKQFAFHTCKLTTITLPSSLEDLENHVFHRCSDLREIISLNPTPPRASQYTFGDPSDLLDKTRITVRVPAGSVAAYRAADEWKDFPLIVEIY